MKKLIFVICLFISFLNSCQSVIEYPDLIIKELNLPKNKTSFDTLNIFKYIEYHNVTTKSNIINERSNMDYNRKPLLTNASKSKLNKILDQIESNIKPDINIYSIRDKEPINNLCFKTYINLTYDEAAKYKENFGGTKFINSLNFKAKILNYDLINEKNDKIELRTKNLSQSSGLGLGENKYNKLRLSFDVDQNYNYKYQHVKGFVELEFEMFTKFEYVKIEKKDLSKSISLGKQLIKILEYDNNIFHYKILGQKEPEFNIVINNCNKYGLTNLSESTYKKYRKNPGLSYYDFTNKFKEIPFINNDFKNIYVYKGDDCNLNEIFFYLKRNKNKVKRIVKIPIDINLNEISSR